MQQIILTYEEPHTILLEITYYIIFSKKNLRAPLQIIFGKVAKLLLGVDTNFINIFDR